MNSGERDERNPVTIQQTAKKYKAIQGIGVGIILLGALLAGGIMSATSTATGEHAAAITGILVCGVGFVTLAIGAALSWWHHG